MKSAKQLFDDGLLSIVQGVGYPNPDRSHFRSMRIWQTASFDDDKHDQEGWLGKALDHSSFTGDKDCVYVGRQETPVSLWSRRSNAKSMRRFWTSGLASTPIQFSAGNMSGSLCCELDWRTTKERPSVL